MNVEEALDPFGFTFGQLQDIGQLIKRFKKYDIPIDDFLEWIKTGAKSREEGMESFTTAIKIKNNIWEEDGPKCPDCGSALNPYEVNTTSCNQVGRELRTQLVCGNQDCEYEEYSRKTLLQWNKELFGEEKPW